MEDISVEKRKIYNASRFKDVAFLSFDNLGDILENFPQYKPRIITPSEPVEVCGFCDFPVLATVTEDGPVFSDAYGEIKLLPNHEVSNTLERKTHISRFVFTDYYNEESKGPQVPPGYLVYTLFGRLHVISVSPDDDKDNPDLPTPPWPDQGIEKLISKLSLAS